MVHSFPIQNETEWQGYQRNCLEVMAKIAELLPAEAFSLLVRTRCNNYPLFFSLDKPYKEARPFVATSHAVLLCVQSGTKHSTIVLCFHQISCRDFSTQFPFSLYDYLLQP